MKSDPPDNALIVKQEALAKDSAWDPDAVLEEALRERELLLKKHPDLAELQSELDQRLEDVDRFEDRMKIIGKMIGNRLNRLQETCEELESLCRDIGIHAELPITGFKQSLTSRQLKISDEEKR